MEQAFDLKEYLIRLYRENCKSPPMIYFSSPFRQLLCSRPEGSLEQADIPMGRNPTGHARQLKRAIPISR